MTIDSDTALAWSEDAATLALLHARELPPELLSALKALDFPANFGMVPYGEKCEQVFGVMREVVAILPETPDTTFMDALAADYASIYLTGALEASPFESFWLSDEHLLCQEAMFELRALYAADGMRVPDWRMRPDDHLVFQLQFIAKRLMRISFQCADEAETTTRDQWRSLAEFLDYHLLRWLPDFTCRVAQRCDTSFYAALALLSDAWCQQLRDAIALHLGDPRPSKEEIEAALRPNSCAEVKAEPLRFMPGIGGPSW
jgi:putative dimethyl sulfoxide reductase chaperone